MKTRKVLGGIAGVLAGVLLAGCSGLKAKEPPFYVYNSTVLNAAPTTTKPRDARFDPLGVEWKSRGADKRPQAVAAKTDDGPSEIVGWRTGEDEAKARQEARDRLRERVGERAAGPDRREDSAPSPSPAVAPVPAPVAVAPSAGPGPDAAAPVSESPREVPSGGALIKADGPTNAANFVQAIYKVNGVDLKVGQGEEAIAQMHEGIKKRGRIYHATRPAVGDVIFFHNTFDRNGDGRNNDWYTHVGMVEGVEEDGTIHVLSFLGGKVDSFPINLEHPRLASDESTGKMWNHPLRQQLDTDPPFTQYLGGELFAGFGSMLGDRTELIVIDNWTPGMDLDGL